MDSIINNLSDVIAIMFLSALILLISLAFIAMIFKFIMLFKGYEKTDRDDNEIQN